jgi:hypothetical protein
MRSLAVAVAVALGTVLSIGPCGRASADERADDASRAAAGADVDARTRGLRVHAGVFALGHAKRGDGASFSVAPGLSLGGAYRFGDWELEAGARGAYLEQHLDYRQPPAQGAPAPSDDIDLTDRAHDNRLTQFAAGGASARWFASRSASATAFLGLGVEYMLFYYERSGCCVGSLDGRGGFGVRAGGGVELWHDQAHARLAIEATALLPMYRFSASGQDSVYLVPVTFGARFVL